MKIDIKIIDIKKQNLNSKLYKFLIQKYKLVILRNFFNENDIINEVNKFKKRKIKYLKKSGDYFFGKKNFIRFDKKIIKNKFSNYSRYQYMHTLFSWNKDKSFKNIFNKLIKLRNNILNIKSKKYVFNYNNKKFINIPKVLHYPNGGFLDKHIDYNEDNDSNFIIVASKKGINFHKGGLSYEIKKKYIEIEKFIKIGDVVCNDHLIKHGVKKIKLKKNQIGRFSLVLSMHKLQKTVN